MSQSSIPKEINTPTSPIELWAGMECTHNRVGDDYFDQLDRIAEGYKPENLALMARLGAKSVRFPVLWEKTAPLPGAPPDWRTSDERLTVLRDLGVRPIVGLLHHGSGPRHTSLVDPDFGTKLAAYASAVAQRYPWVPAYTPVNESLTTARFSGLYGYWYPHGKDDSTFTQTLLNQCRGTVMAMRAIREVNPNAQLIQTEDLGYVASTPLLQYQADFENERRWLSLDLLCGRVDESHPLWGYLVWSGASEAEIRWFAENACPPGVIGLNYYLTSQRFLHDKLSYYPAHLHGGNGRHRYVDVELVRVRAEGMIPLERLLQEVWKRYEIPLAITECHNGCSREEQLRWVQEVWRQCRSARAHGVDLRAITAWSFFGAMDWNTLVTQDNRHYETGVFDTRSPKPRATALARTWKELGSGGECAHPVMEVPGWWERPERLVYGVSISDFRPATPLRGDNRLRVGEAYPDVRPLLITGARGTLGRHLAQACEARMIPYRLLNRQQMDIADPNSVSTTLAEYSPWAVINAAGYVRVDDAESDPRCWRENVTGPEMLALSCADRDIELVTYSSDLVFDGQKNLPYTESDATAPLNEYGRSKAAAERAVLSTCAKALVIRTSAFFSAEDDYNFVTTALRALASGEHFRAVEDCVVSPTFVIDLAHHTLDLLIDGESGIWHLANQGKLTWFQLAKLAAEQAGISTRTLSGVSLADMGWTAERPLYSALASERGQVMPTLESALQRYVAHSNWLLEQEAA